MWKFDDKRRLASGTIVERRLPGLLVHDFRRTAVRRSSGPASRAAWR